MDVNSAASKPPVQDSAVVMVFLRAVNSWAMYSSRVIMAILLLIEGCLKKCIVVLKLKILLRCPFSYVRDVHSGHGRLVLFLF